MSNSAASTHTPPLPYSLSSAGWLTVGLVAVHSIAAVELGIALARRGPGAVTRLGDLLSYWAGSMVVAALAYGILCLFVALPLRLLRKLPAVPLAIANGALAGSFTTVVVLSGGGSSLAQPLGQVVVVAGLSCVLGLASFLAARAIDPTTRYGRSAAVAGFIAPLLAMEALFLAWLRFSYLRGLLAFVPLRLWIVLVLLIVAGTAFLFRRDAVLRRIPVLLATWTVVLVGVTAWHTLRPKPAPVKLTQPVHGERRVPHVILITVDTLRADALGGGMDAGCESPAIDALAADGVNFESAHATSPWTPPSMASIMTGLSPNVHGVGRRKGNFPPAAATIGDFLHDQGYLTAAFGANVLLTPQRPLYRSFDVYEFPGLPPLRTLAIRALSLFWGPLRMSDQHRTEQITASAEAWVKLHADQDFFLWLHYFDPHAPYLPPREFLGQVDAGSAYRLALSFDEDRAESKFMPPPLPARDTLRRMYCSEVRYVDDRIGRLVRLLRSLNVYDDALIVLTSDHGEEFWEHGSAFHGHSLHEELLRVPLILKLPGENADYLSTVSGPVANLRVTPTILDITGTEFDPQRFSGTSLRSLWESSEGSTPSPIFSSHNMLLDPQQAVLFEKWKYIRHPDPRRDELYHLPEDPDERVNLAIREPERVADMRELLDRHHETSTELREQLGIGARPSSQQQQDMEQRLRSLGYVE